MDKPKVVLIDYGVGNLLSVQRGLEHCGAEVVLTADPGLVVKAERVVLPGVGAFGNAMQALNERNLVGPLQQIARQGTPLLGICLGMQLLLDESEEFGLTRGLGIVPGRVLAIPKHTTVNVSQKIPHIGWNALVSTQNHWQDTLLADTREGDATYFVHSYMAVPDDTSHRLADCVYGGHRIPAVIAKDRTTGCQFHPEKSGEVGLTILRRFCAS
jgi:glutamine amidotransferase